MVRLFNLSSLSPKTVTGAAMASVLSKNVEGITLRLLSVCSGRRQFIQLRGGKCPEVVRTHEPVSRVRRRERARHTLSG